jgi:chlorite dismutase
MTDTPWYLHVLALGLDPAWRRRSARDRADDWSTFVAAERAAVDRGVTSTCYSSVGLQPGVDLLLWRHAPDMEALEEAAAALLRSSLGGWLSVTHAFLGRSGPSQYVAKPTAQEQGMTDEVKDRYLIVYPFTKSARWYLSPREERQAAMNEHMKVGRRYPMVRQALAYSFGLDDQDFVVSYETDDLGSFGDLVRDLRGTESRRETVSDVPILLGVHRPMDEIGRLLGAVDPIRS